MDEVFFHQGQRFRVIDTKPNPKNIKRGDWVRICHDPYSSKPDIVAYVFSCRPFWPLNKNAGVDGPAYIPNDYLLELARDGDHSEVFQQLFSEEYIELIDRIDENASHRRKNIVVCFDGTWNQNDLEDTNPHRIIGLLDRRNSVSNYYSGVGAGGFLDYLLDGATGRGLFRIVRAGYTFVKANYLAGDRIFIFGFSRGAYAARHLAGMIARCGLDWHPEATYDFYKRLLSSRSQEGGRGCDVQFLGLFDCVPGNQLYMMRKASRGLNSSLLEMRIKNFAHAASRDERRWSFKPLVFQQSAQAIFEQRWFPGYHFDVGGDKNTKLNNFSLAWILSQACRCGLSLSGPIPLDFDPLAKGEPSDWLPTKLGLTCIRSKLTEAALIDPSPSPEALRKEISALTHLSKLSEEAS